MIKCKNCNHEIYKTEEGKWNHYNYCFSATARKYYRLCGVVLRGKKFEEFKKRWLKKYGEEYNGKHPICGCNKPEPKESVSQ